MTPFEQKLLSQISEQTRLLRKLVGSGEKKMTAEEIQKEFMPGKSLMAVKKYLQLKRKDGALQNIETLGGKNIRYDKSEIEKLFTAIKN